MNFKNWLRQSDLSEKSVNSYCGALKGIISKWARGANLITGTLLQIQSYDEFERIDWALRRTSVFIERNASGHNMYGAALKRYGDYLSLYGESKLNVDLKEIAEDKSLTETTKQSLVNARLGQGDFRKKLLDLWSGCSVTGIADKRMLIASHIKPWSKSDNSERLDKFNGLLLIPNLDKAFDRGLISFAPSGDILISDSFSEYKDFGINRTMKIKTLEAHSPYLDFHKSSVFEKFG